MKDRFCAADSKTVKRCEVLETEIEMLEVSSTGHRVWWRSHDELRKKKWVCVRSARGRPWRGKQQRRSKFPRQRFVVYGVRARAFITRKRHERPLFGGCFSVYHTGGQVATLWRHTLTLFYFVLLTQRARVSWYCLTLPDGP